MYIKLNFTSGTNIISTFRILADIINNNGITNIGTLRSRATTQNYNTTLLSALDDTNSVIYRTNNPINTKAHIAQVSSSINHFKFTLEQSVYDNVATKYYTQLISTGVMGYHYQGDVVTGGNISSTQLPVNSTTNNAVQGTNLILGNSNTVDYSVLTESQDVTCAWFYVTDSSFIYSFSRTTGTPLGWNGTYGSGAYTSGPFISSQYTRYDNFNNDSNGILPVIYSNSRGSGQGLFGNTYDWTYTFNPNYSSSSAAFPLKIINTYNASSSTNTTWPKQWHPPVAIGVGTRDNSMYPLSSTALDTTSYYNGYTYGTGLNTTANYRYPNSSLTSSGFQVLPLIWSLPYYNNYGGNVSEQGGFYIFNGEYAAGDEFTMNSKIYSIWPTFYGPTYRIGIAIPKE
ncbi:hypothetical protein UFOVP961_136 [uncultured Caudovirales phage]|uniref:Uncharacterized protein n=1 Tax=uncultured Caudovirales phage TaxID=2100421 RepID=A0A6J5SN88_9CAUD|nr:hypothetical protein UFOVP961_136 [uncultured Caudovirales phage]CAB4185398.1 hypothetical protein UFOVP1123_64 [uncultured Caudovirales phage]CAB4193467.1 hypothetical protein UFOVP1239_86 [uncultured Caudovirales phage]CAB4216055.1 hypothetical protein UFOVP1484_68 [uncultured Caudovirales phage]CAB5230720.1 hypothetical protein UFOVP1577_74 [uncultured Caudovirales phage]